ncbi:MAG TPA: hypothetical protein VL549_10030 [Gemmatimonadales bacterium]|nr:hypothetical protein [Gemmatimonadales bacterium]
MTLRTCCSAATAGLVILACATGGIPSASRSLDILSPDNRAVISDFSDVEAVAATPWLVFAATTHGLLIYDRVARSFRQPVTTLDGYPSQYVRRAIADPTGNAVWLDLGAGFGYVRYDVDGRTWTPGSVPSAQSGPDGTLTVARALASAPLADAMRAAILTDRRLRTHEFTAAAATSDRPEIFFGTNGLGLIRVDRQTGEWEVLTYGLLAPSVGALAVTPDGNGVWAASNTRPGESRRGITWVARDFSATRSSDDARGALGLSFQVSRKLIATGGQLWLATEQGVFRIDPQTFASRLWDVPEATTLAATTRGIWVGTTRGLFLISGDRATAVGPTGFPITSLLPDGDTLLVGTSGGLGQVLPDANDITTPPDLADRSSLRVTVRALGRLQDTILMATDRELAWRDPATRAWNTLPLPPALGIPTAIVAHAGALWIGGTAGLAQVDIARAFVHVHPVPFDVPAPVRDLAAGSDYLWAATDSGLVRLR